MPTFDRGVSLHHWSLPLGFHKVGRLLELCFLCFYLDVWWGKDPRMDEAKEVANARP